MQRVRLPGRCGEPLGRGVRGGVEDDDELAEAHGDHAGGLVLAGEREGQGGLHLVRGAQGELLLGGADGEQVAVGGRSPVDLGALGGDGAGGGQERLGVRPLVPVVGGGRETPSEAVAVAAVPVQGVEPVAAVVGVAVQGLGAQQVGARLGERGPLGEDGGGHGDHLGPGPLGGRGTGRELEGEGVEEGLVVVGVGVGERVAGHGRVSGGRPVVVDVGALDRAPGGVGEGVVGEVAGEADLDQVLVVQQPGLLLGAGAVGGRGVGVGVEAGGEALDAGVLVEGAAAAHGVAGPVGEGGDAGAGHVLLGGLDEAGVIGDLAEVPALAVQNDLLAVDAVLGEREPVQRLADLQDVVLGVVAHQVEAEAVDLVLLGPGDDGVDDELAHHGVLGRGVGAAGGGGDGAVLQEPLVVAGHDPVEDRLVVLPGGDGVVVDDVHDRAQSGLVEALDHLPELDRALGAVRVGGVGALGDGVVERVVAPVEAVLGGGLAHALLLLLGVGCGGGQVAVGRRLVLLLLRDGPDVEDGQQVDVARAGVGELLQVPHALGAGVGEGEVFAGVLRRAIRDREVPDVQLLDLGVPQRGGGGLLQAGPAARRELRVGEVDDEAAGGVGGQGGGVGVGDLVGDQLLDGGGPDGHGVPVGLALPALLPGDGPDAGAVVALHRDAAAVEFERDGLRGRGPHGERRCGFAEDRAEFGGGCLLAVQVVQDSGGLYAGGGEQGPVGGALGRDQLAPQGLADAVAVAGVHGERRIVLQVGELGLLGVAQLTLLEPKPLTLVGERPVHDGDAALLGVHELLAGGVGGLHLPDDGVRVDPLRLGLGQVGGRAAAGLREEVAGLAAEHPDLVAVGGEVEGLVAGEVLLVALVEDVAERGRPVDERYLEGDPVGVLLDRHQRLGPVGGLLGPGPGVQPPAVVVPVRAVVVEDRLGGVLRRGLGGFGRLPVLALLDPDLSGHTEVDGPLRSVGRAVLLDGVRDGVGALLQVDPGERAVRVAPDELGGLVTGLELPAVVVAVGALVVDDGPVALDGYGLAGRRGLSGGGGGESTGGAAGAVDDDGLVAQRGARLHRRVEVLGDLVRGVVGGAEGLPLAVAGLGGEDDPVELSPVHVGGDLDGAGGAGGRGLQRDGGLGGGGADGPVRLQHEAGQGGHGDGDLLVLAAADRAGTAVHRTEVHLGRLGGELDLLRGRAVVGGDEVLVRPLGRDARGGVHRAVREPLDLGAVAQRRVLLGELRERGDGAVDGVLGVVRVRGVGAVGAELVVVEVVGGLRGEEGLAGVLVAARAGEALLVAVVDHRVAAAEEHQLVGEPSPLQQFGVIGLRVVLLEEGPDAAHVVVAEEGDLLVGVGLVGGVAEVVAVHRGELVGGRALGGELPGGVLEREVQCGVQAAPGDVRGCDLGVGGVDLAEHEEVVPAALGRVGVERGGPPGPEVQVDVFDGVDAESVDVEVADPLLVDLLHALHDLGTLGPQVVEPGEVAVLVGLAGPRRVAPVVVHGRVVEPGRNLLLRAGGLHRRVREGVPVDLLHALAVVEGAAGPVEVGEGALGLVAVGLLRVVDGVGGVVGDDVEEDLHALGVGLVDQLLQVGVGAEVRVDLGEVGDPVAVVARRRVLAGALDGPVLEDRGHPDGGGAEALDVVELLGQALEVAALVEPLVGGVVAVVEA
ncbi:hypothetical protein P376_1812 [Streptomyces sp. HCCB10043]|nr:hypothetical protein P376_1812 [Streptomyces sp. HCCB10043]